jgi:hypothetical protein
MVSPGSRLVPPLLHVDALLVGEDGLTIRAVSEATEARCPHCDETADRVHSRSPRTLVDLYEPRVITGASSPGARGATSGSGCGP